MAGNSPWLAVGVWGLLMVPQLSFSQSGPDVSSLPKWATPELNAGEFVIGIDPCGDHCFRITTSDVPDSTSGRSFHCSHNGDVILNYCEFSWFQSRAAGKIRVDGPATVAEGKAAIEALSGRIGDKQIVRRIYKPVNPEAMRTGNLVERRIPKGIRVQVDQADGTNCIEYWLEMSSDGLVVTHSGKCRE